jgi:hypothetical protein
MANSHRFTFNNAIQGIATSFAKYVIDNKEKVPEMTEDELITGLMGVIDAPRVPQTSMGMTSLAPSLNTVAKTTKSRAKTTKEVPPQLWIEADEYKKRSEEGQKICAYLCERSAQENKKNRVCAAKCEDTDIGESTDPFEWRCVSCKGKSSNLKKKLDGNKKASPKVAVPGTNVVAPRPVLPNMPQAMTAGIVNMAVPMPALPMPVFGGLPSIPTGLPTAPVIPSLGLPAMPIASVGLPAMPTMPVIPPASLPAMPIASVGLPTMPVIPKAITPKKPSPKKLEPIPALSTPESSEDESEAVTPAPEPTPAPAPSDDENIPAPTWSWLPIDNLAGYYTCNQPGYKKVLFKQGAQGVYSVGRINGQIDNNAVKNLVHLNDKEQTFLKGKGITYTYEGPTGPALPSIPSIPGLPGLP